MGKKQEHECNDADLRDRGAAYKIAVPIRSSTLRKMMEVTLPDSIIDANVVITESAIEVSGKAKKSALVIPFKVVLNPHQAAGRMLYLKVDTTTSLGSEWVSSSIFPNQIRYEGGQDIVVIDLNQLDIISKIVTGTVQSFEIKDATLWVTLGTDVN